jgi:hypothetical protein
MGLGIIAVLMSWCTHLLVTHVRPQMQKASLKRGLRRALKRGLRRALLALCHCEKTSGALVKAAPQLAEASDGVLNLSGAEDQARHEAPFAAASGTET